MECSISDLYDEVRRIAKSAGLANFPRPADRRQEDRVWLEKDVGEQFSSHYMERGQTSVLVRGDYETVLFEVFRSLTQTRACEIEFRQRIQGEDSRRQWYALQGEMMAGLKEGWGERIKVSQAEILARHPFMDK